MFKVIEKLIDYGRLWSNSSLFITVLRFYLLPVHLSHEKGLGQNGPHANIEFELQSFLPWHTFQETALALYVRKWNMTMFAVLVPSLLHSYHRERRKPFTFISCLSLCPYYVVRARAIAE